MNLKQINIVDMNHRNLILNIEIMSSTFFNLRTFKAIYNYFCMQI